MNLLDRMIAPIAKAHGCSPARLSIAWLVAKPVVTSRSSLRVSLDQLQDNLASLNFLLTPRRLSALDEVSVLPPEYPVWVLPFQGGRTVWSQLIAGSVSARRAGRIDPANLLATQRDGFPISGRFTTLAMESPYEGKELRLAFGLLWRVSLVLYSTGVIRKS